MIIASIENNSIAQQLGLKIGDKLRSINGHVINDIIDYRFYSSDEKIEIEIDRNGEIALFSIEKDYDEELGILFVPRKYRCCGNKCIFCFVDQNPPSLRPHLYFKDEDFRLSFLHGNYVTLTNISNADLHRISEQRLAPLYISVHATDVKVRTLMLGLRKDDNLLQKIQFLVEHNIELHAQIVLCPDINDGKILDQTITDLVPFYPMLKSVAIVPVGLTKHRKNLYPLYPATPQYATTLIEKLEPITYEFKKEIDSYFVYLADEFYVLANDKIPTASRYEDYYQYENGVGMLRYFIDNFNNKKQFFPKETSGKTITIVTGELAGPFIDSTIIHTLNSIKGIEAHLVIIPNHFYGSNVTVSGLLTGTDIYNALEKLPKSDLILLPKNCINNDGLFLDDWTLDRLTHELNQTIKVVEDNFTEIF
jgi:putative radical SAM enzyme (TIGR03279 family)